MSNETEGRNSYEHLTISLTDVIFWDSEVMGFGDMHELQQR